MCKRYKSLQQDCIGEDVRQALELFDCQLKTHFQPGTSGDGPWSPWSPPKPQKWTFSHGESHFIIQKLLHLIGKPMENPLVLGYPLSH